ncbi:hypothetical protein YB2330_003736 [Saitoella coloradoensis]
MPHQINTKTVNPPVISSALMPFGLQNTKETSMKSWQLDAQRIKAQLDVKYTDLDKYMYLASLRREGGEARKAFYKLMQSATEQYTPLVYTPTVGLACQKFSEIFPVGARTYVEGMYLNLTQRGQIAQVVDEWAKVQGYPDAASGSGLPEICVITDGSRILGLGDLGLGGMGIPLGKLSLYTACAGIDPQFTIGIQIDLGTNNEELLNNPLYLGLRHERPAKEVATAFMDEVMQALHARFPAMVIQFEDFIADRAFEYLDRYRDQYASFNDDIQGTGAVVVAGVKRAAEISGVKPQDQRIVFFGAGSAGVGVAKMIAQWIQFDGGVTEEEARRRVWLVDSKGLVAHDRGDNLAEHKLYFARDDNNGQNPRTLDEVLEFVKPTALLGLSTIGGAFTPSILKRMGELNDRPVVFPLSNPSHCSECTYSEALNATGGRVVFASGSPFAAQDYEGTRRQPGQGNNMYVFPGIGLGAILSKASRITETMIYASAESLASSLSEYEQSRGLVYPELSRIREISAIVAAGVIRKAVEEGVCESEECNKLAGDEEGLLEFVKESMWDAFSA